MVTQIVLKSRCYLKSSKIERSILFAKLKTKYRPVRYKNNLFKF
ncbi:hypothetical protein MNB_SV-6-1244 [hydrothermal vent metagenome]|uniref:Uncharacterized protein n=1 Tax=hydrothermal vent metagenome TaxID=652676 RepID=A0A1W1BA39_9ZZZZ